MARQYRTRLIITGDASGGIRAIRDTDDQLGRLNRGFERGTQRSRRFQREVGSTSTELATLRRAAAPLAATLAGVFAANTLKSQIDFADQLQKTNIRIGASTEALSEYQLVAKLSGVEFNQLATAWQRQTRRIAQAAEGTGEAQAALESLNLSAKDLSQLAPEQQFEHIARAMQGVASEAERVALAQKVWDSEGVRLLQIVNQGTDAIEAMRQQARDLGLSISGETASAMAGFNDQIDTLSFAAQGVSQTMLAELVPSLSATLQSLNAFIADAGGAEEVLGDLATIGGTLASVYAGRVAASLASSTAALTARTVASIRDARAEGAAAQAVARRTAAELASAKALLSTARLEAQATKGTAAHTFALNQLSAARRRAATAAGAHNTATAASTAAMARAGVVARGLSGALALVGGPLGLLVGGAGLLYVFRDELGLTQVQIGRTEDELADLREEMAELSEQDLGNSLESLNVQLSAMTLKAALAREELAKLKSEDSGYGALGIDNLGEQVRGYNAVAEAQASLKDIEEQRDAARRERLARIGAEIGGFKTLSEWMPQVASGTADASEEFNKLKLSLDAAYKAQQDYAATVKTLDGELRRGSITQAEYTRLKGLAKEQLDAATGATKKNTASTKEAAKADKEAARQADQFADSLLAIEDRLFPLEAAQRKFQQDQILLQTALMKNEIGIERYLDAWQRLESSQRNQDGWQDVYDSIGQVNTRLDESSTFAEKFGGTMSSALEDAIIDFESFGDVARGVLEDIQRMLIRQSITDPLADAIGGADWGGMLGSLFNGGANVSSAGAFSGTTGGLYADGGYTGQGATHEPAGIVHKGEFVVRKSIVEQQGIRPMLERLNSMPGYASGGHVEPAPGYASGGHVSISAPPMPIPAMQQAPTNAPRVSVQVIDQRSGGEKAEVQETRGADGMRRIRVMIRDEQKAAMSDGSMDSTMSRYYGVRRRSL